MTKFYITFVGGDTYSAPVMHIKRTGAAPLNTFFYLHRDYLGSILTISDSNGVAVERRQFGAWGVTDKFWNTSGATVFNQFNTLLDRGYTGHEHMFFVSLINMNGRVYDPVLGRFLSPDNFVQDPFNTQNFNRYGYVVNNPLMYVDQNGEFFWIPLIIGAFMNVSTAIMQGKSFGQVLLSGAIGAAAGIIGGGVSNLVAGGAFFSNAAANVIGFGSGFMSGAAGGLAGGFVGGTANAWANGASLNGGLLSGVKGGLMGGLTSGIGAGIRANKIGLDFMKGDIVKDAAKFNNLFKSDLGAVACTDCSSGGEFLIGSDGMFQNGESIRSFRADLSGPDDFGQVFKAFKKASILNGTKYKDLFQVENMNKWVKNGWKPSGLGGVYNTVEKDFFGLYRLSVGTSGVSNYISEGIRQSVVDIGNKIGSQIYIAYRYVGGSVPLASWYFFQDGPGITQLNNSWFSLMQTEW